MQNQSVHNHLGLSARSGSDPWRKENPPPIWNPARLLTLTPKIICQWLEDNDFSFVRTATINGAPQYDIYVHAGKKASEVWVPVAGPDSRPYDVALRNEWPERMLVLIYCIAALLDKPQVDIYLSLIHAAE